MFYFSFQVQVFGNSPDETAFCRLVLNKETTSEALLMLQPELISYQLASSEPEPVMLDVTSIAADRILLLDSYFYVVVFHGSNVAAWRKQEYHLQAEHAGFKTMLEVSPLILPLLPPQPLPLLFSPTPHTPPSLLAQDPA